MYYSCHKPKVQFKDMDRDTFYMQLALREAEAAKERGEVPVGCLIVCGDEVVATGSNCRESDVDPTGHAEIIALRSACKNRKYWRLADCEMYVTLEPCVMCAGAIMQAHVARLVYGAYDPKNGACGSNPLGNLFDSSVNHHTAVEGGILEKECGEILRSFFRERRQQNSKE